MRSFRDELEEKNFEVIYKKIEEPDFEENYTTKIKFIEENAIETASIYEIEDKPFEKELISELKKIVKVNYLPSPMFLNSRSEFKDYHQVLKNLV